MMFSPPTSEDRACQLAGGAGGISWAVPRDTELAAAVATAHGPWSGPRWSWLFPLVTPYTARLFGACTPWGLFPLGQDQWTWPPQLGFSSWCVRDSGAERCFCDPDALWLQGSSILGWDGVVDSMGLLLSLASVGFVQRAGPSPGYAIAVCPGLGWRGRRRVLGCEVQGRRLPGYAFYSV